MAPVEDGRAGPGTREHAGDELRSCEGTAAVDVGEVGAYGDAGGGGGRGSGRDEEEHHAR